jgi:hypothetical protein
MPVRWSPLKVKEATERVEEIINPLMEPLEKAKQVVAEARKLPNLAGYVEQRLARLQSEIERVTGYKPSWSQDFQKGNIQRAIEDIRRDLPKRDLAREQAEFEKMLGFFNGDRQKVELAMNLGKIKAEVPKEQLRLEPEPVAVSTAIQVAYNPVGEAIEFVNKGEIGHEEPEEEAEVEGKEICYGCGRSVAEGSGSFVNRVPSLDSQEEREDMGVPYPEGGYTCDECDTLANEGNDPIEFYLGLSPEERKERGIPEDFEKRCNAEEIEESEPVEGNLL